MSLKLITVIQEHDGKFAHNSDSMTNMLLIMERRNSELHAYKNIVRGCLCLCLYVLDVVNPFVTSPR